MSSPGYLSIAVSELERYMSALEIACEILRHKPEHAEHYERTKTIHDLVQTTIQLYATDYLLSHEKNIFTSHRITPDHKLNKHSERSEWERYLAGARSLVGRVSNSYLFKSVFTSYGLEWLSGNVLKTLVVNVLAFLKYLETTGNLLETYMTWIEYGASLAVQYINANALAVAEENEEVELVEASDLYTNIYVRAYAMLKTFNGDSQKAATALDAINNTLASFNHLIGLTQKLYIKIEPDVVENTLHSLTSNRQSKPTYLGTKFAGLQELNTKLQSLCKTSLEEPHGLLYNVREVLDAARQVYVSKLTDHIIETLAFLPTEQKQENFTRDFELGNLWKD
jgi:hypothetical protein